LFLGSLLWLKIDASEDLNAEPLAAVVAAPVQ
jgi:hypothetical protein